MLKDDPEYFKYTLDIEVKRRQLDGLPPLTSEQISDILSAEVRVPLNEYFDENGKKTREDEWRWTIGKSRA